MLTDAVSAAAAAANMLIFQNVELNLNNKNDRKILIRVFAISVFLVQNFIVIVLDQLGVSLFIFVLLL